MYVSVIWVGVATLIGVLATGAVLALAARAAARDEVVQLREGLRRLDASASVDNAFYGAVGKFVGQVIAETTEGGRVELIAERLAEVDLATAGVEQRSTAWARVCLYSGSGASLAQLTSTLAEGGAAKSVASLLPFVCGAAFATGCHWIGRVAGGAAVERRRAWDALSLRLLRPLSSEQAIQMLKPGIVSRFGLRNYRDRQLR